MVNDAPIKIIIDSGSPVTLLLQRLFNDISEVTKINTSYKDVNDNNFEFLGQGKATVRTNNTTLQLPLLIAISQDNTVIGIGIETAWNRTRCKNGQ